VQKNTGIVSTANETAFVLCKERKNFDMIL
jgi:hypothetical protein